MITCNIIQTIAGKFLKNFSISICSPSTNCVNSCISRQRLIGLLLSISYTFLLGASSSLRPPVLLCIYKAEWVRTDYLHYLGSAHISWCSQKQKFVPRSSTEAKYKALGDDTNWRTPTPKACVTIRFSLANEAHCFGI
ncbi:hypothetical protein V2J09_022601 [Rumex salicifolius]